MRESSSPNNVDQGIKWSGQTNAATVATAPLMLQGVCDWSAHSQITSLKVFTTNTARTFNAGSYIYVYGS